MLSRRVEETYQRFKRVGEERKREEMENERVARYFLSLFLDE